MLRSTMSWLAKNASVVHWGLAICLLGSTSPAFAWQSYLDNFNAVYGTAGTRLDSCGLCHYNFAGGGARTPYGEDFRTHNYDASAAALRALDSDLDGATNDQEAAAGTLTHPGLSCNDLVNVVNAPLDLADWVQSNNVGCLATGSPPVAVTNGPYVVVNGSANTYSSAGSYDPDGTIVSYLWNFGSGYGTSTDPNPVFTYTVGFDSRILVSLTVTDNDGNSTTETTFVNVVSSPDFPPTANINPPVSGQAGSPVLFSGAGSSDPERFSLTYNWNFGDGTTGSGISPAHVYNRCGTYNVSLTVYDPYGQNDTATTTATISSSGVDAPTANAGGDATSQYYGSVGSNVQFNGSASSDPDCNVVSYAWNFGDGSTGTGANPVHSYAAPGDYVVSLTVTDNDGLTATALANVSVTDAGTIDGAALYATNCSACHNPLATTQKPNRTATAIQNAINSNTGGMGTTALLALTPAEVQAIADALVSTVPLPPTANAGGPYTGQVGTALTLSGALSTDSDGTISSYAWDFGDGTTGSGLTASHTYTTLGTYTASLTVTDNDGLTDTATASVTISDAPPPAPDGAALYGTYCSACHNPLATTQKPNRTATQIQTAIDNGTGGMNTTALQSLTPEQVQAIADALVSTVPLPPTANAGGPYTGQVGTALTLSGALSTDSDGTIASYAWNFGDGTTGSGITASHTYTTLGTYTASLTVTDNDGLTDTATASVTISDAPPPAPDGAALYGTYCSACHQPLANTLKPNRTATAIQAAIDNGTGGMNTTALQSLTPEQVQAIADALATGGGEPLPPPTVPHNNSEGGVYHAAGNNTPYTSGCASCHGARLRGATGPSCYSCHGTEWNQSPPSTTDGETLYGVYCAGCHYAGSDSTKQGATVSRIDAGIASVPVMNSLEVLSSSQIQAISNYLVALASGVMDVPHTNSEGGVLHATGNNQPYTNGCASCHGARLRGALGPSCYSCHGTEWNQSPPSTNNGETLYGMYCAGCHGAGSDSTKVGASLARINNSIDSVSLMSSLSVLTSTQRQAVSDYLVSLAPPTGGGGGGGTDGAALYGTYCSGCHNPLATTQKPDRTATQIQNAINNGTGGMNTTALLGLTPTQVQAIADALATGGGTPTPTTGVELYDANCGNCHGYSPNSTKNGADLTRINNAIASNAGGMGYLGSSLTQNQLQLIADYLVSQAPANTGPMDVPHTNSNGGVLHATGDNTPYTSGCASCHGARLRGADGPSCYSCHGTQWNQSPPTTNNGETLYAVYCAGCHLPGNESSKRGASVDRINNGINSVSTMSSLSVLTTTQRQAISDYLVSLSPPPTGGGGGGGGSTDGATLYGSYCAGCHNPLTSTQKPNRTATQIQNAIDNNTGGMGTTTLRSLTSAQVQAIADALATGGGGGGGSTGGPMDVAHNDSQNGADHASGKNYPYTNGCASCHGARLRGATGPSCYSCHGTEWNQSPPSTNNGETLYATYCAGCHLPGNESTKIGANVTRINNGISSVSTMNSLSVLSSSQRQAIADYLAAPDNYQTSSSSTSSDSDSSTSYWRWRD